LILTLKVPVVFTADAKDAEIGFFSFPLRRRKAKTLQPFWYYNAPSGGGKITTPLGFFNLMASVLPLPLPESRPGGTSQRQRQIPVTPRTLRL